MKKNILVSLLALALMAMPAMAQEEGSTESSESTEAPEAPSQPAYEIYGGKSAISLNFGAIGGGLEYAYNFHKNFNGRLRFSTLPFTYEGYELEFDGNPTLVDAELNFLNIDLMVEYLPFTNSSFKLVGGLGYFSSASVDVFVQYDGTFNFGDIELTPEDIGQMDIGFDWSGVAPYLGFGFGRAVPRKRVGFGMELGAYYTGAPEVTMNATEALEPSAAANIDLLRENMEDYAFLPYFQFRIAVRLN